MSCLQSCALIGDAVGGIATAVALLLAIFEVRRRRTEARHLRQSQAASRALIALTAAHDAYQTWLDPIVDALDTEDPDDDFSRIRAELRQHDRVGRTAAAPAFQELYQAYTEALVHLGPATAQILSTMHEQVRDTPDELEVFYLHHLGVAPSDSTQKQVNLDTVQHLRRTLKESLTFSRQLLETGAAQLLDIARLEA